MLPHPATNASMYMLTVLAPFSARLLSVITAIIVLLCGNVTFVSAATFNNNKCIRDDTKAAARQSLNCIKNKNQKIKYGEKRFSIWRMKFLHPAMWHVALESWQWIHQVATPCNVIRGSEMTYHWIRPNVRHIGILYLFSISTHHRSRHVIFYQSAKFYPNRTTLGRKKMTS